MFGRGFCNDEENRMNIPIDQNKTGRHQHEANTSTVHRFIDIHQNLIVWWYIEIK